MQKIISIHSFRGGTGKSNTTANIAAIMARHGKRVAVVDTDIQSPGIHVLFQLGERPLTRVLNDYLWGECDIGEAAYDVTEAIQAVNGGGRLFLIPASTSAADIARVLRDGYNVELLSEGFKKIVKDLQLDALIIDTHPGLNEETLLSIAISNSLLVRRGRRMLRRFRAGVTGEPAAAGRLFLCASRAGMIRAIGALS